MDRRWPRRLGRVALLLLIFAAGQAVFRIGLERALARSFLLLGAALDFPRRTAVILLVLTMIAVAGGRVAAEKPAGASLLVGRLPSWLVSIVIGVGVFNVLALAGLAVYLGRDTIKTDAFHDILSSGPLVHAVNVVLVVALIVVVIRRDPRAMLSLAWKAFCVAAAAVAWLLAAEVFFIGTVGFAVEGFSTISNYLLVAGGLLLIFVWSAALKYAFRLPLGRAAIAAVTVVSVLMTISTTLLQFLPFG